MHLLGPLKETPKSSVIPVKKTAQKNLTLFDWMMVYACVNTLPQPINQGEVITLLKVEMLRSSGWCNRRWVWHEARVRRVRRVALTIKTPK